MIRIHPRAQIVSGAEQQISRRVAEIANTVDLTHVEVVSILLRLAADWHRFVLRSERHPDDPNKKADEA